MATKKQLAKLNHISGKHLYSLVVTVQLSLQLGEKLSKHDLDPMAKWELQTLISKYSSLFETHTRLPP